jgi:Bacterial Ig-like domain
MGMRKSVLPLASMALALVLIGIGQGSANAEVTGVKGNAYGYFASVSLFGGPPNTRGPTPTVTLPSSGSATPITATAPTGLVQIGPAILFSSGQLDVSTRGTTGSTGLVTSSTNIQSVNTSGNEVFTADNVASRCTATEADISSGSTTITNGTLQTSEGNPDVEGDETVVQVPTNPAPNTTFNGQIEGVGDSFRYVFNEQIRNPDGSITVNAAHQIFLGPTAVGDLIIGRSVCGVTATTTPTGTKAPKVNRVVPAENATGIPPGANVSAIFSEAMRAASINTNTVKLFKAGTTAPLASVVSYDAERKLATLNPNANLQRGIRYKAVVTTGARDLAGNQLDQDQTPSNGNQQKVWLFTVRN